MNVYDNVAFPLREHTRMSEDEIRQVVLDRLDMVGLLGTEHKVPGEISGGMKKRAGLARALVTDPAVLLLDEPFGGLDVGVATSLRIALAEHLASYSGVTLLVTHDALDALTLADRVVVIDEGRIAQTGTPHEVAARPRTEHVARLVGLNVVPDGDVRRSFPPSAVTVSLARPEGSARLTWRGRVAGTTPHGDALRLLVATEDGPELLADVTPAAAVDLGLTAGREVWLTVKATATTTDSMRP